MSEIIDAIESYRKPIQSEINAEHFLQIQNHLVRGACKKMHVDFVLEMTRAKTPKKSMKGKVKTKKKEPEHERVKVTGMTLEQLTTAIQKTKGTPRKVSMIAEWLQSEQRFHTQGKHFHLWRYDPDIGVWTKDGEDFIRRIVTQMTNADYRSHICNETVNMIQNLSYDKSIELGGPAEILVLKGGRLNLTTKKHLKGFDPEEYQIAAIPVDYDPNADCPAFKQFLSEVLENDQDIQSIFELIGYCLWKGWPYDMMVILVGAGANGKSVLLDVMTSFLGKTNVSAVTLQQLAENRFASSRLRGKLANIAGEIPNTPIIHTNRIKDLTGGGIIEGEYKFRESFSFYSVAVLIFSSNNPPPIYDDVTGVWRRLRVFNFPNTFLKGEKGTVPRDKLLSRLTTSTELSGILNQALDGWSRLRKNGKLTGDRGWEVERLEYLRVSNPVQYMVEKFIMPDHESDLFVKSSLYDLHLKYCVAEDLKPISTSWFHKQLKRYAPFINESQPRIEGGKQVRAYSGLDIDLVGLRALGVDIDNIRFKYEYDDTQTRLDEYDVKTEAGEAVEAPVLESFSRSSSGSENEDKKTHQEKDSEEAASVVSPASLELDRFTDQKSEKKTHRLAKFWFRYAESLDDAIEVKRLTGEDRMLKIEFMSKGWVVERGNPMWIVLTTKGKEVAAR